MANAASGLDPSLEPGAPHQSLLLLDEQRRCSSLSISAERTCREAEHAATRRSKGLSAST
jgi:hypothetical protein